MTQCLVTLADQVVSQEMTEAELDLQEIELNEADQEVSQ